MHNLILDALAQASTYLDEPAVSDAYQQLTQLLGVKLTGEPLSPDKALTPTQLVLIRHALKRLSPANLTAISEAAYQLQQAIMNPVTVNITAPEYGKNPDEKPIAPSLPPVRPIEWTHDIFISYSRKDAPTARRIYADLRAKGMLVWMDDQLTPGTPSWQTTLEKAIRSAGCVVVILSPAAKASEWVEREINMAQTHGVPVVPLLTEGTDKTSIPLALCNIQWTPMRDQREYRANLPKVIAAIREFNA